MKNKNFKMVIIAVISVIVCLLSFTLLSDADTTKLLALISTFDFDEEFSDEVPMSVYNFERLNATEKKAYIAVFNSIAKHPEYIKIPELTNDEFRNVYFAVKNDNPDILCFPDACDMVSFYNSSFIHLSYKSEADACNEMMRAMESEVAEISALCEAESDYEKELFYHDYIIKNCAYNENAAHGSDAYGCLVDNSAYCSGYSRAMMLLLERNGIDCILVSGYAQSDNDEPQSHMWNIVNIDGKHYFLDVTWDDHNENGNSASHMFFNVTGNQLLLTHSDISVEIDCSSADANYFVREGLLLDKFDSSTFSFLGNKLSKNVEAGVFGIEFTASDSATYDYICKKLFQENVSDPAFYSIINSMTSDAKNSIDVSHINTVTDKEHKYIRLMFDKK